MAADTATVIQIHKLTKVFRDAWHRPKVRAVDDLTLDIRRGEVFGLLGPNGSGKSTTIKLLLNLLFPTSGTIRIFGLPPRDPSVKARLGFLPEETYLYPYLNASETLEFFGRLSDIPRAELRPRVEALIEMVGLSAARRRPLREYSKGMARRIGIAQALINDPELLLLDEPTTGLDPIATRETKDLILRLKEKGKTILMCSHLLADVEDVCDRIGILYGGRLCAVGTVRELLEKQQLTQITIPDLEPETLRKIEDLVREIEGDKQVSVGHPMERLEQFFLRIIREAREQRPHTAGAGAGRFNPELFRNEATGRDVIERLTSSRDEAPSQDEPQPTTAPEPDRFVLEKLTRVEPPREKGTQPEDATNKAAEDEKKRNILDRLVKNPKQAEGSDR